MNTFNQILAAKAGNGKSYNNVWVVYTSEDKNKKYYCTSAYKAMRLTFLIKKRTGLPISENCLTRLSHEIAAAKAPQPTKPQPEQPTEPQPEEKPKKRRGRKPKAEKAA